MKKLFWVVFFNTFFIASHLSQAAEFSVSTGADFQAALTTAASNGQNDTISLAAGTYDASIDGFDSGVTGFLYQADSSESFSLTIQGVGAGTSILTGSDTVEVLSVNTTSPLGDSGHTIQISNLSIVNGAHTGDGGGAKIQTNAASVLIEEVSFENNQTLGDDISGGALSIAVDLGTSSTSITLENNTFENNHVEEGCLAPPDCANGGGAILYTNSGEESVTISGNSFSNNQASGGGGLAIAMPKVSTLQIENNTFDANAATIKGGDGGGGLSCSIGTVSSILIEGNTFTENTSADLGGGIWCPGLLGASTIISNNLFQGNTATSGGGFGGLSNSPALQIFNNIVVSNTVSTNFGGIGGAGILLLGAEGLSANIVNNTITGNIALTANGGGLATAQFGPGTITYNIYNNIIFDNSGVGAGQDILLGPDIDTGDSSGVTTTINANDYSDLSNGCEVEACSVTIASNNINSDPLFTDTTANDYTLQSSSPCIGTASALAPSYPSTDFLGNSRANSADMGALEFATTPTPTPTPIRGGGCSLNALTRNNFCLVWFYGLLTSLWIFRLRFFLSFVKIC